MFDGMRINSMGASDRHGLHHESGGGRGVRARNRRRLGRERGERRPLNFIPKTGGNTFSGSLSGLYTSDALQSDNLTDELRARGLNNVNKVLYLFHVDGTLGGPISRDKLWFFTAHRVSGNQNQVAGIYFNKTQGTPLYTPDYDRPAYRDDLLNSHAVRLTWQVSPKNRVNIFGDIQRNCVCRRSRRFARPKRSSCRLLPAGLVQATWSAPLTNRLLLEARAGTAISHWPTPQAPEVGPNDIATTEQSTGFVYGSNSSFGGPRIGDRFIQQFSASYVTGSHALKAGVQVEEGTRTFTREVIGDVTYRFLNSIPNQITQYRHAIPGQGALEGRCGRLRPGPVDDAASDPQPAGCGSTTSTPIVPEQHLAAGPWVPARDFAPVYGVPAVERPQPAPGRGVRPAGQRPDRAQGRVRPLCGIEAVSVAQALNPVITSVNTVNRTWNDANRNYVPDCDLANPLANGECGGVRQPEFRAAEHHHALRQTTSCGLRRPELSLGSVGRSAAADCRTAISVTFGYYRNWSNNFRATDNLEVIPADYSPFCITAPLDTRLPGGGGYPVCGLYDVAPSKFGRVNNLVVDASQFGTQRLNNDFFNVSANGRLGARVQFGGGVDTGRTVADVCFTVDSPQALLNCRVVTPG